MEGGRPKKKSWITSVLNIAYHQAPLFSFNELPSGASADDISNDKTGNCSTLDILLTSYFIVA